MGSEPPKSDQMTLPRPLFWAGAGSARSGSTGAWAGAGGAGTGGKVGAGAGAGVGAGAGTRFTGLYALVVAAPPALTLPPTGRSCFGSDPSPPPSPPSPPPPNVIAAAVEGVTYSLVLTVALTVLVVTPAPSIPLLCTTSGPLPKGSMPKGGSSPLWLSQPKS